MQGVLLKMELAEEKTGICNARDGFVFLGYSFRRGKSLVADKEAEKAAQGRQRPRR